MTYRKIAQLAGVSLSTVSKALSGSREISEETAQRIRKIAEENGAARQNSRKIRTYRRVAIVVPEIVSVHYSTYATQIAAELNKFGIDPCIYISGFDAKKYYEHLGTLAEEELMDGIILLTDTPVPQPLRVPIVQLTDQQLSYDTVVCDTKGGITEAVRYLKELGHSKIGFISEINTGAKLEYFRSAMDQLSLPLDEKYIFVSDKRFAEIGMDAAEYYLTLSEMPSALIAAYDEVALGAIHVFRKHGVRIPEDISIIGINDIPSAAYASIPLTTISTFTEEMVQQCVKMLLDHMKRQDKHMIQNIRVICRLVVRDTTARAREE
jgi:LacI family transcriptional regulator